MDTKINPTSETPYVHSSLLEYLNRFIYITLEKHTNGKNLFSSLAGSNIYVELLNTHFTCVVALQENGFELQPRTIQKIDVSIKLSPQQLLLELLKLQSMRYVNINGDITVLESFASTLRSLDINLTDILVNENSVNAPISELLVEGIRRSTGGLKLFFSSVFRNITEYGIYEKDYVTLKTEWETLTTEIKTIRCDIENLIERLNRLS